VTDAYRERFIFYSALPLVSLNLLGLICTFYGVVCRPMYYYFAVTLFLGVIVMGYGSVKLLNKMMEDS